MGAKSYDRVGGFIDDIIKLKAKYLSVITPFQVIGLYFYQGNLTIDIIRKWFSKFRCENIEEININDLAEIGLKDTYNKSIVIATNSVFLIT